MDAPIPIALLALVGFAVIGVAIAVLVARHNRRRRQAWAEAALQLGLAERPPHELLDRFGSRPFFQKGHGRKARALFHGTPWGPEVWLGDYEWVTGSGKSQSIHRVTFCLVDDPRLEVPHFVLTPEHPLLDRIATLFGMGDVDFEDDPEFSRAYRLTGADAAALRRRFTVEVRAQLLHRPERLRYLEGAGTTLLLHRNKLLDPATSYGLLREAQEIHAIFR